MTTASDPLRSVPAFERPALEDEGQLELIPNHPDARVISRVPPATQEERW